MAEVKPYYGALEDFIREIESHDVYALCLVALCNDEGTHDVVTGWGAGPFESAMAAGILQLHAGMMYQERNAQGEEYEDEEGSDEPI